MRCASTSLSSSGKDRSVVGVADVHELRVVLQKAHKLLRKLCFGHHFAAWSTVHKLTQLLMHEAYGTHRFLHRICWESRLRSLAGKRKAHGRERQGRWRRVVNVRSSIAPTTAHCCRVRWRGAHHR